MKINEEHIFLLKVLVDFSKCNFNGEEILSVITNGILNNIEFEEKILMDENLRNELGGCVQEFIVASAVRLKDKLKKETRKDVRSSTILVNIIMALHDNIPTIQEDMQHLITDYQKRKIS